MIVALAANPATKAYYRLRTAGFAQTNIVRNKELVRQRLELIKPERDCHREIIDMRKCIRCATYGEYGS